jgi:hypothetical protein
MWSYFFPNERKELEVKVPITVGRELKEAKQTLLTIWDQLMPLRSKPYDQPYGIDDKTVATLLSEIKDEKEKDRLRKIYNPFKLSNQQHKNIVLVLSMIIQIVDNLYDGFKNAYSPGPRTGLQFKNGVNLHLLVILVISYSYSRYLKR